MVCLNKKHPMCRNRQMGCYTSLTVSILVVRFENDLAVFLLERANALADEIQNLPVCRAILIFSDIVKLAVQLGIDFDAEVFVPFVSHIITEKS